MVEGLYAFSTNWSFIVGNTCAFTGLIRTGFIAGLRLPDGRVGDSGEILDIDPPRRLVVSWRNEFIPEMREEGYSRCAFDLEPEGEIVKLTILHEIDKDKSKLIEGVSGGWPKLLSALKTLLETGKTLPGADKWPEGV